MITDSRERPRWDTDPAKEGERVLVRNIEGRKWYAFECVRRDGELCLQELFDGNVKKLVGEDMGDAISIHYQGVKMVDRKAGTWKVRE